MFLQRWRGSQARHPGGDTGGEAQGADRGELTKEMGKGSNGGREFSR